MCIKEKKRAIEVVWLLHQIFLLATIWNLKMTHFTVVRTIFRGMVMISTNRKVISLRLGNVLAFLRFNRYFRCSQIQKSYRLKSENWGMLADGTFSCQLYFKYYAASSIFRHQFNGFLTLQAFQTSSEFRQYKILTWS